jgi:hypothetical protein
MKAHASTTGKAERLLFRYRTKDTRNGVTKHTTLQAAEMLGVSETQLVHMALAQFVAREVAQYPPDDGPLSDEAWNAIERRALKKRGRVAASLID